MAVIQLKREVTVIKSCSEESHSFQLVSNSINNVEIEFLDLRGDIK